MSTVYTLDASVFVSGYNAHEVAHEESRLLLKLLAQQNVALIEPTLLLPEIAAAVARVYGDEALALDFARTIERLPTASFVALNQSIAQSAVEVAARYKVRGSDAVYAAVAKRYNATLVTLDQEQADRVWAVVPVGEPSDIVARLQREDDEDAAEGNP